MMTDYEKKDWAEVVVYTYECPNCGIESDVHIGERAGETEKPAYCPNCGAEVVE